jgi:hypothetical protein
MVMVRTREEIVAEEKEKDKREATAIGEASEVDEPKVLKIIEFLDKRWERARRAKVNNIEPIIFKNIRQAQSKYEPKKLAAIREMGGSDVFIQITDTKCRNMITWIRDIEFQSGGKPWGIEPEPVPELSKELMDEIKGIFVKSTMDQIMGSVPPGAPPPDMNKVIQEVQARMPQLEDEMQVAVRDKAEEKSIQMTREMDTILRKGGWYNALNDCIPDLVIKKNAFIKGPIKRYKAVKKIIKDEAGNNKIDYVKEVVREWERVSPFDCYPEPDVNWISEGYLFHHVAYRRKYLAELIGVPGYREDEIRAVLKEHLEGGLKEWTGIEGQREEAEKKDTTAVWESDRIEGLDYYGSVQGEYLIEWGVEVPDPDIDYECTIFKIGKHVIGAIVNPDPEGNKPWSTASFEDESDNIWGNAYPEKIEDCQTVCNACARAVVNNIGMGSGPQVEINIDRIHGGLKGDMRLIPWKRWLTTNKMMQTGQAINFWQPQMHAQEILTVYSAFSKIADERGIPSYAHGDPQVGGGGNTASGLSMLITQASRIIKGVIRNMDRFLIIPSIENTYNDMLIDPKYVKKIGDINLVAKGSSALIEKEQRAVRMLEFLNSTNNDIDQQITGIKGRAYLLGEVAKSHEIDPEKALAGMLNPQPSPGGGATPPAKVGGGVDEGGNKVQGQSTQLVHGAGGHPALPERG